jgi:hypothetical protein
MKHYYNLNNNNKYYLFNKKKITINICCLKYLLRFEYNKYELY